MKKKKNKFNNLQNTNSKVPKILTIQDQQKWYYPKMKYCYQITVLSTTPLRTSHLSSKNNLQISCNKTQKEFSLVEELLLKSILKKKEFIPRKNQKVILKKIWIHPMNALIYTMIIQTLVILINKNCIIFLFNFT